MAATAFTVPILAKLPLDKVGHYAPWAVPIVSWAVTWDWTAIPAAVAVATLCGVLRKCIVNPEVYASLKELLDHLHDQMFPNAPDEHSRVTLFRFHRWSHSFRTWPWRPKEGGWLIAVMRSGEMHQDFKSRFRITSVPETSQGVAGMAWCLPPDIYVRDLPDVSKGKQRAVTHYAKLTGVSEQWVRQKVPRSRSFYAIKIRDKKKQKWGVVVVDSTDPQLDEAKIKDVFSHTQRFLSLYATKV